MYNEYEKMANDFLVKHNATIEMEFAEQVYNPWNHHTGNHNVYDVTISRNGDSFDVKFTDSVHNTMNDKEPTSYDILACLEKYGWDTYKEFCEEYGYLGSEETLEIYQAVQEEYNNVVRLFGDCMEELQEIQ